MNLKLLRSICFLLLAGIAANSQAQPTQFDTSFDGDGELVSPFPGQAPAEYRRDLRQLAPSSDGTILVAGTDWNDDSFQQFRILKHPKAFIGRLSASNGQPITSYGGLGTGVSTLGDLRMVINDMLALPDGSALVCGDRYTDSGAKGVALRVAPDGQLDASWGTGSEIQSPGQSHCYGLELLGDGRVVMVGSAQAEDGPAAIAQYLDRSGQALFDEFLEFWPNAPEDYRPSRATAVVEQPGLGVVILVGAFANDAGTEDRNRSSLWLVRLTFDGQPDPAFGLPKEVPHASQPQDALINRLQADQIDIDPTGRIRLGLTRFLSASSNYGVAARNRNIDGSGGINTDIGPTRGSNFDLGVGGATLGPDGKSLILSLQREDGVGCSPSMGSPHPTERLHLLRTTAGSLQADSGFDGDGQFDWELQSLVAGTDCIRPAYYDAQDVMLQRNGRITVLGTYINAPPTNTGYHAHFPALTQFVGNNFGASPWDIDPNPLSFSPASARPNAFAESDFVEITGLDASVQVPAYVLGGEMRVGFGSWSSVRWVKNGDWVQLRAVAPASNGASNTASLFVGGIRAHNSWDSLGDRKRADFVVTTNAPALPGARCSAGGLNSNCSAAIPDEGSVSSSINFVNGGSCNFVQGVRVGVDIEHSYIGDLRIKLTDPNGQVFIGGSEGIVTLLNRPKASAGSAEGSCSGDDIIASFDDAASIDAQTACGVPVSNPALSGDVAPAYRLSELVGRRTTGNDGANANGLWTLTIDDLVAGNSGQLHDWSLDIDCSASAPAISDLSVTVDGHTTHPWLSGTNNVVPGAGVNITWTVTNNGPMATSNGRFRASLPDGLTDAIEDAAWGCGTSAGGSCTPAIPCFGACLGNDIDAGLSLPVGGTATFFATGTLTELAGDGTLVIHGKTSVPQAIGGTRDDNPDNDNVQLQMPIQRITDIAVTAARHSWQGNVATIELDYSNAGPSNSLGFIAYIELPTGMNITGFSCRRGNLPCDDRHDLLTPIVVNITHGNGMLPNRTPYTAIITATWPGSNAPGSLYATLAPDATAIDTAPPSFEYAIGAPGTSSGDIFSNGFE